MTKVLVKEVTAYPDGRLDVKNASAYTAFGKDPCHDAVRGDGSEVHKTGPGLLLHG